VKIILVIGIGLLMMVDAGMVNADQKCKRQWGDLISNKALDNNARVDKWKSLEGECGGHWLFGYRLSILFSIEKRFLEAEEIINKTINENKNTYIPELEYAKLSIRYDQALAEPDANFKALRSVLKDYVIYVSKNEDFHIAVIQISGMYMILDDMDNAILWGEKANKINPTYHIERLLTLAYYNKKLYRKSVESAESAISLDEKGLDDTDFMIATALSFEGEGNYKRAKDVLNSLLINKPTVKNNEKFRRAVKKIMDKLKGSE
jgi:tetratricopeptide (TPR) repeat protein